MISYKTDDAKLRRDFKKWQKRMGDSNKQAVVRLSVGVARETAILVEPRGKSKAKSIHSITVGTRVNIVGIPARDFNALVKKAKPTFKLGHQWVTLRPDQILRNESEIMSFVESNRNSQGRVTKLPPRERAVAKKSDLDKVTVKRKKRAGIAKGSILGAGMRAARFQRGGARIAIGKNVMAWAQKHSELGKASRRRSGRGPMVLLDSRARHTKDKRILSKRAPQEAARRAWKNTTAYYRRAIRESTK